MSNKAPTAKDKKVAELAATITKAEQTKIAAQAATLLNRADAGFAGMPAITREMRAILKAHKVNDPMTGDGELFVAALCNAAFGANPDSSAKTAKSEYRLLWQTLDRADATYAAVRTVATPGTKVRAYRDFLRAQRQEQTAWNANKLTEMVKVWDGNGGRLKKKEAPVKVILNKADTVQALRDDVEPFIEKWKHVAKAQTGWSAEALKAAWSAMVDGLADDKSLAAAKPERRSDKAEKLTNAAKPAKPATKAQIKAKLTETAKAGDVKVTAKQAAEAADRIKAKRPQASLTGLDLDIAGAVLALRS